MCSKCKPGFYSESAGAHACEPCPLGGYCEAEGASSLRLVFTQCPPGTYGNTTGLKSAAQCAPCPDGSWCRYGNVTECGLNTYANTSDTFRSTQGACIPCGANAFTTQVGANLAADCLVRPKP